jgi:DNA-binding XRE family transcriptional regulator
LGIENKISEHLKSYRAKHDKTQEQMAKIIGVSTVTYQEMEKGIVKSLKNFNKIKNKTGFTGDTQESIYSSKEEEEKPKIIVVEDSPARSLEYIIRLLSKVDILFSIEAEKTAVLTGQDAQAVLDKMNKAAQAKADILYNELKNRL